MTILSAETRRMLELSRAADVPSPDSERAVRERLIAELGVAALTVTSSTAAASAEALAATSTGALSAAGSPGATAGSAGPALLGATTSTAMKTVAGLALAAGLGAGAFHHRANGEGAARWPADIVIGAEALAGRAWNVVTGREDREATSPRDSVDRSVDFDERRHALLIAIARRPYHPVAKEAELVLILRAEQALASGDDARATKYLDAHEASFEVGALSDSRESLRVLVDCARGAAPEARARAERFVTRFPSSDQIDRWKACPCIASSVEAGNTPPSPSTQPAVDARPGDESKF